MWRVLQIHTGSGWEVGLAGSLAQEPDLEVQSVTYTDETTFLRTVMRIQPDVILMNKHGPLSLPRLRKLLNGLPALSAICIIAINVRNNIVDIDDAKQKRQLVVTDLADLCKCIRGEGGPT
jgi:hypothetical protein